MTAIRLTFGIAIRTVPRIQTKAANHPRTVIEAEKKDNRTPRTKKRVKGSLIKIKKNFQEIVKAERKKGKKRKKKRKKKNCFLKTGLG